MSKLLLTLRRSLFAVGHLYADPLALRQAQGVMVLLWVGFLSTITSVIPLLLLITRTGAVDADAVQLLNTILFAVIIALVCFVAGFILIKRRQLRAASVLFVLVQLLFVGVTVFEGFYNTFSLIVVVPLVVTASLLGRTALLIVFGLLMGLAVLGGGIVAPQSSITDILPQVGVVTAILTLMLITAFFYGFSGFTQRLIQDSKQEIKVLRQIMAFASNLKADSEESVYAEAIGFVRSQLGYTFAQIFYIGSDGKLSRRLQVTLGVRNVTEQYNDVTLSDGSIIEESYRTRQLITTSNTDAPLRRSHFMPASTYGAALPIVYDGELLGVLDVQSDSRTTRSATELSSLQAFSEQIAVAATHTRLIHALRENVRQQEELVVTLRARLQEMRRTESIDSSVSWQSYVEQRGQHVFGFDLAGTSGTFIAAQDLPASLRPVIESGARQILTQGDLKVVNIPINLRGEILGAMSFTLPKERVLTERQLETAELVANRLALALENKRLFEQTQAQALRERRANEATNLLITATNVESVMNVAAATFNEALGAIATHIHLQPNALKDLKSAKDLTKEKLDTTKEAVAS